jgi:hypothetical protein
LWCWWRLLKIPWTARRTNKLVLYIIKPDTSFKSKILKQKLKYLEHIMRNDNLLEEKKQKKKSRWEFTTKRKYDDSEIDG